ncbi:hypothetical protein A3G14_05385 [Candidatus Curtissbacteria bacterium RIFCSPLOWO2_12_FULL_38_9]|uniref:ArnT-like N-terminal domain-containing protein n=1 Tax=Candidatus Curtissbacteria bacterium RIFCSPLOWO2_12_FULL_38_9 TaxID=1797735 RepID=A0A1F5IAB0_9BACT|nr:MAG: hypothetical protein A3G14_05385 [Candidatus Curtissbacteria bacterium RIFCSPLOWO2_12_FULL_38_9]
MIKKLIFWLIIVLAFILRFYKLGEIPFSLNWDEVSNAYNAYSILNTGRDEYGSFLPLANRSFDDYKPPLYMYLNILTVGAFGLTAFAARLPSAFFGFLSVPLIYFLTKLIFEKSEKRKLIALLSMFLFSTLFWHLQFSRMGLEANIGLFATLASMIFFLYGLKKYIFLLPSAISFSIALYSYHAQRFFLPLFLMILVLIFRQRLVNIPKKYTVSFTLLVLLAILSLFIFLPQKAILSRLQSSSFKAEENQIERNSNNFVSNEYSNKVSKYLENYFSHFSPNYLFIKGDDNLRHHTENSGMLPLFYLPISLIGLYFVLKTMDKRKSLLIIWLTIAPLPAAVGFPAPHAIRSGLMMIPLIIVSAIGLYRIFSRAPWAKIATLVIGGWLAISFGIYLHNYYTHYAIHSAKDWQYGYKEASIESEKLKNDFDKISVSEDFEQAHIFWLFYTKYDPASYQKFGNRGQFDKFNFGQKKFDVEISKNDKELFVSFAQTFPRDFKVLKTIYYPDNSEAIKVGHYEKD